MSAEPKAAQGFAALWAGTSFGGALIAAPAKFQAETLTLPVALDVGRAQFFWVGAGEAFLCACFLLSLLFLKTLNRTAILMPIMLFAAQRLVIMPQLDARTLQVISGQPVEPSSLHLVFVALEVLKFLLLAGLGLGLLKIVRRNTESPGSIRIAP